MTLKLINTIAQRATDRDGLSEADRREISDLGRTKLERAKIYKALDAFVDLVVTKQELGKFVHQLKLNSNARSSLMGIIGHDGMGLLRKQFTDNPGIAHAKLVDPKSSAKVRAAAAAHIASSNDPAAVHVLTNALKTERDWTVRFAIAKALISVDSRTRKRPDVITILVTAYRKGDARVRAYVLGKLRDIHTGAVTDIFIDASKDRNPVIRSASIRVLAKNDDPKAKAALLDALKDKDESVRAAVPRSLKNEVVRVHGIIKLLKSSKTKPEVRDYLIKQLSQVKEPVAQVVIAELAKLVKDRNVVIRWSVAKILKSFRGKQVSNVFMVLLGDRNEKMRVLAVEYFAKVGNVRGLVAALKDKDGGIRFRAMGGLEKAKKSLPYAPLLTALKDPLDSIQRSAIHLLTKHKNPLVISALIAGSKARKRSLRHNALWALLRVKNQKALRALAAALKHPDKETRRYVENRFLEIKTKRYSWAVPALIGLLKNRSWTIRNAAGWALCRIGTERALLAALKSSDAWVREAVVGQLGEGTYPHALRTLISLLEDPDPTIQGRAIRALIDKKGSSVVPAIVKTLSHPKTELRKYAVDILAERKDPEAVIALPSAIKSDDPYVRKTATQSLLKDVKSLQTLLAVLMDPKHRLYGVVADLIKKYKQYYKPMLGKMLRGNSNKWALGALTGLGAIGDADAVTELLAVLKRYPSDTDFQRYAARDFVEIAVRALVKSKDPRVLPAFSKLLKERGFNIWPQVLRVLIRAKFPVTHRAFYDNRNNYNSWFNAVRLVQGLDKPGNIRAITEYIKDAGLLSSRWIVAALVEMNDVRVLSILLKVLAKEERYDHNALFRPEGYSEALKAFKKELWRFARPEAIPYFAAELEGHYDTTPHYEFIIKVLSTIGGPRVTSILLGFLPSEHPWISDIDWAAVAALSKTKNPRVEAKLIDYVKEKRDQLVAPDNYVDPYIKALGEMESKKAVPLIINKLKSYDVSVRMAAATALGKIKDRRAIKALVERMLNDEEGSVRGLAARALGEIGDPRAIKVLLRVSEKDTDEWVRNEALKALHKLPGRLIRAS